MKIIKLRAENVKRLVAIEISPDPGEALVIVRGNNAAGKSSVLESIKYAFAGRASHPPKVIRDGEKHACVEVETEDLIVVRKWKEGAEETTTEVEVRAKDGTKIPSPQKVLDKLFDALAFDALEFVTLKPKEQLELLKKLVPGADTTKLDADRKAAYDARTLIGRDLDSAQARLKAMPTQKPEPAPDPADLRRQSDALRLLVQKQREATTNSDAAMRRVNDMKDHVAAAEAAVVAARKRLEAAMQEAARADNAVDAADDAAAGAPEKMEALAKEIDAAGVLATANARWAEREKLAARVDELKADHDAKDAAIFKIDAEKSRILAEASFPVDGLGFGPEGVSYKGLPFEQASQAEQLRVSVAIGAARNPKLRVMTVREGSRLDRHGLKLLAELAKERDVQVWLEAVGEDGPASVVIVDGVVRP